MIVCDRAAYRTKLPHVQIGLWSGLWQQSSYLCFVEPEQQYHLYGSAYICSLCWAIWAALPLLKGLRSVDWVSTLSIQHLQWHSSIAKWIFFSLQPSIGILHKNQMAENKLCRTAFIYNNFTFNLSLHEFGRRRCMKLYKKISPAGGEQEGKL